ncbi:hypothetical protein [Azospirillum himalayense]|uniref:Uncharacterized protein n=1 Tax=Azospirillum himalayense TaxID=654847 RepID=A0ABW0G306_9PROT
MSTAPSTELAVLPPALVPATVFAPGGVETILTKLEADVRTAAKDLDISTDKGRKAIASLAYKVARSKTALDDMGKGLVEETKKQVALIDADRRVIRDRLDALKDEVRKPLDDFEAAEKARIERHEAGIADIQAMPLFSGERTTDDIAARLAEAQAVDTSGFQEFMARAEKAKETAVATLTAALENSRARDAERAELERLRREAEERAAREEAERIEREKQEAAARAAEQARREAEEKARREAEEAERRAASERERIEREAREAQERAERAERDHIEAERRAEEDRKAAEERARQREEAAARQERQRIEDERKAEEEAQRRREADRTHRATVNKAAVAALVTAGLSDAAAKTAITAIAKGSVPHVAIAY